MLWLNITNTTIITVKNVDYRCVIDSISKYEAINLLKIQLLEIESVYKNIALIFSLFETNYFFYFFCLIYIKWLIAWTSISL